jgi:predicted DNA-binding transcriptional regulator AlpA
MPRKNYYGDEISLDAAAAILGCSRKTLLRWDSCGYGPPRKETGSRRVAYSKAQVETWKAEHGSSLTATATRRRAVGEHASNCKSGHPLSDSDDVGSMLVAESSDV